MKLIKEFKKVRTITYFGIEFVVPLWVRFIATNQNGAVAAYNWAPKSDHPERRNMWTIEPYSKEAKCEHIADVELGDIKWTETLMSIPVNV